MSSYKNIVLIFGLGKTVFLLTYENILIFALAKTAFCSLYKMVDSKNSPDNYKTLKISIGTLIKYPEMIKFVPDYLKTKKVCKRAVKKLPIVIQ